MFHFTELFTRDRAAHMRDDTISIDRAEDYLVLRDGEPFAILNATPSLAERTMAGFARTSPEVRWALTRSC